MRVAVTGASGFVGGAIARRLHERGASVYAFGRRAAAALARPLPNYTQWDITQAPPTLPAVDAVVHCAALVGDWGPERTYQRVNADGSQRVLAAFADVDKFVHVSSASVYAHNRSGGALTENAPAGRGLLTAYARSKTAAEALVLTTLPGAVILRPHIVYGPGDPTLMPRLLAAVYRGYLPVPGDGRNSISVTHICNLVHAAERALASQDCHGIFNIADEEAVNVDELLRTMLRAHGVQPKLVYIPRAAAWAGAALCETLWRAARARRAPRLTRYLVRHIADPFVLDITRARRLLDYMPQHTFRTPALCAVAAK